MVSALVVGTNTYVLQAAANTYLGDSARAGGWDFVLSDDKDRALLSAFKLLQKQSWASERTGGDSQVPSFPRLAVSTCDGVLIDSGTVPPDIEFAQMELAYDISQDNTVENAQGTGSNVKRAKAGSASIEFFNNSETGPTEGRFPPEVQELVACYLAANQPIGGIEAFGIESPGASDTIFDCDYPSNRTAEF